MKATPTGAPVAVDSTREAASHGPNAPENRNRLWAAVTGGISAVVAVAAMKLVSGDTGHEHADTNNYKPVPVDVQKGHDVSTEEVKAPVAFTEDELENMPKAA